MNETLISNSSGQNHIVYDVVIAGAGPVGLLLACELALAKCSVLILEKADQAYSPLKQLPFGIRGLSAPSVEALYRRGLLDELELHKRLKEPHSLPAKTQVSPAQRQVGHFAGIPLQAGYIDASQWEYRLPGSTEPQLLSEMEELETVLTRRATTLGVIIKHGTAITGFEQAADGVTVLSGNASFEGKWLVGCDGARSVVRKAGGFEFAGTAPEFTGYTAKVDIADAEKLSPGRNFTSAGMYMQSQPGYLIMQEFDGGAFHSADKPLTVEHLQALLRRISNTDVTITALYIATTWTDRARQATAYRNGRVLLAGDAAHIHSPLGGQGLNLGLGDAMNLGWKLAATIRNEAPEGLLDTYYAERYPVGEQVLDWSRAQVAIMKPEPASRALNAIMRDLMHTRDGATYMAGRIWGIFTRYQLEGDHPLVGCTVPDFDLEDGRRAGELIRDGRGILLDFSNDAALKTWVSKYGSQISYMFAAAKEQLGVHALLIRPDGIVVWATGSEPDYDLFQKAVSRWFAGSNES